MKTGIGIDFGTSNTLVSFYNEENESTIKGIEQRIDADIVHTQNMLPSCVFLDEENSIIVGEYARKQASSEPERSITSVKSWLCNHLVNRQANILPWDQEDSSLKRTPSEICTAIINHAITAHTSDEGQNGFLDDETKKVLTIPASFDELARQLTQEAAKAAGLKNFIFLEEPLAALYSWLSEHQDSWRDTLNLGDLVLVCDIGGGTTDFTLVGVIEKYGTLSLERLCVGNHILLGGDNIDLALSYLLAEKGENEGKPLDEWQQKVSIQILKELKEKALSEETTLTPETEYNLAIPSRKRSLFSNALGFSLQRTFFTDQIIDGFFPILDSSIDLESEKLKEDTSISDTGLPYESDPRFTIHLLEFLKQSFRAMKASQSLSQHIDPALIDTEKEYLRPTKILFNGGMFNSSIIRERIITQLNTLFPNAPLSELPSRNFDESVARGAAYFSYLKSNGEEIPVKAGIAHALYLGVKENKLAVPGIKPKLKGICVMPQGSPEGSEFILEKLPLTLRKGIRSDFMLYTSKERGDDVVGDSVNDAERNLNKLHTISAEIPSHDEGEATVPVTLRVKSTEIGTLEIWMDEKNRDASHQVEFKIR